MAIADFVEALKTTLAAGDEGKLLNEFCDYPEALGSDDVELLKTLSALSFA